MIILGILAIKGILFIGVIAHYFFGIGYNDY